MNGMATFRISEADAGLDIPGLLARVAAGEEVIIESGSGNFAVVPASTPVWRSAQEILARLPKESSARIDEDFARDVKEAVMAHREPLNPPNWD